MKKLGIILLTVLIAATLIGCASGAKTEAEAAPAKSNLPEYVLNPPLATDAIYGVGYAKQSSLPLAIKVAEANARADIAAQLEATIQAAVISYAQEAGVDDNTQVINFAESITRQITDTTLSGAVTQNRTPMDDGGVWVLMVYGKESLIDSFEDVAEEFERNEDAAFAEFKAAKALEQLDYQLSNNPTKSAPVSE